MKLRAVNGFSYFVLVLLGLYLSVYQSVVSDITAFYGLTAGQTGLMISFHFLGSFLMPLILGEIGDRAGTRPVLQLAFLIMIGGLALIVLSRAPVLFFMGILLVGGGFAVIEGMLSGLLAVANPDRLNAVMNLSQMYFCLGAVGGPFIVLGLKTAGLDWHVNYGLILLLLVCGLAMLVRLELPAYQAVPIKGLHLKRLLKDRIFILLLLSIFLYVGVEEGTAFWVSSYIQDKMITAIPTTLFIAAYWLGMAAGRWAFQFVRGSYQRWLLAGLAGSGVFMSFFLLTRQIGWILPCLFLVGLGFAPAWPVLITFASRRGAEATNTAMGAMLSLGAVGGMVLPFALGQIAQYSGMAAAMVLLPLLLAGLMGLILLIGRPSRD